MPICSRTIYCIGCKFKIINVIYRADNNLEDSVEVAEHGGLTDFGRVRQTSFSENIEIYTVIIRYSNTFK